MRFSAATDLQILKSSCPVLTFGVKPPSIRYERAAKMTGSSDPILTDRICSFQEHQTPTFILSDVLSVEQGQDQLKAFGIIP